LGKENKEKWRFGRLYFPSEIYAFFSCKSYNSKRINRAVLDKILVEIRDKTRRNAGLEVCI